MNLGQLIDRRHELKNDKAELNKQMKALDDEIRHVDGLLIEKLDEQGIPTIANENARITITEDEVFNVTDWDAFYAYIADTNQPQLLQRRIVGKAVGELALQGVEVPGTEPVTLRKLSIRKVS